MKAEVIRPQRIIVKGKISKQFRAVVVIVKKKEVKS